MRRNYSQLEKDILFEQSQIEAVVLKISELKGAAVTEPNTAAIASYMMNFYNGIENIMKRCAKEYYKKMPQGKDWHNKLLRQSAGQGRNKAPLFPGGIIDKLFPYLSFRHFFIHGYSFALDWDKMVPLVEGIEDVWPQVKACIAEFLKAISPADERQDTMEAR